MRSSWKLPLQVLQLCTVTAKPHRKQKMQEICYNAWLCHLLCTYDKHTHTYRKISVENLQLDMFLKHRVAQTFLTVSHSDMSDLVKSNKSF